MYNRYEMNEVEAQASCLEALYTSKLTLLAKLKQSILQKAFAGELTANLDKALTEVI